MNLDSSSIILLSINFVQVIFILFLLTPFFDIVTLSKNIKLLQDTNVLTLPLALLYVATIITSGIITPTKTLSELNSAWKRENTANNKLRNIIATTNASRNYILGSFSLFFLLVTLRIIEFLKFSAKLVEFSHLMANYDLIDVAYINNNNPIDLEDSNCLEEDNFKDYDIVRWPSAIDFNEDEQNIAQNYFKLNPKCDVSELNLKRETKIIKIGEETNFESATISKDTLFTLTSEKSKGD
ncbi:unnamed protein product [Leptosia nina]|uniref:Uncharacterized protein n=1 Tax=Leptosia nina TaxID=320188 RepID=A0AAV1J1E4_9NEOP